MEIPTADAAISLTRIDGGFRVKTTERHHIDVMGMMYNWRICTTLIGYPQCYDRHWCYEGISFAAFMHAVLAAYAWDGADDSEPAGWNKNGQTGEWRPPQERQP